MREARTTKINPTKSAGESREKRPPADAFRKPLSGFLRHLRKYFPRLFAQKSKEIEQWDKGNNYPLF